MIQFIEFLGTGLFFLSYLGMVFATGLLFISSRKKELLISILGIAITEIGRLFRLFGPSYSVEQKDSALRLTEDSSIDVFLSQALIMPLGLVLVMIGYVWFAWNNYKAR